MFLSTPSDVQQRSLPVKHGFDCRPRTAGSVSSERILLVPGGAYVMLLIVLCLPTGSLQSHKMRRLAYFQ